MAITFNDLPGLMRRSFSDPAGAMRALMASRYDRVTLWSALVLVSVLSALTIELTYRIAPLPDGQVLAANAMTFALIIGSLMTMLVFAIYYIGHILGGTGTFPHTLLMMSWFQAIAVALQLLQVVILLFAPPILGLVSVLAFAVMIYVWLHLIATVHGFSLMAALGTLVIAMFGVAFGLLFLLTLIGATAGLGGS